MSHPSSPINKKFHKLSKAKTPTVKEKLNWRSSTITLEYIYNPGTESYTDNMRIGVHLKTGLSNAAGLIKSALEAPRLSQNVTSGSHPS